MQTFLQAPPSVSSEPKQIIEPQKPLRIVASLASKSPLAKKSLKTAGTRKKKRTGKLILTICSRHNKN